MKYIFSQKNFLNNHKYELVGQEQVPHSDVPERLVSILDAIAHENKVKENTFEMMDPVDLGIDCILKVHSR